MLRLIRNNKGVSYLSELLVLLVIVAGLAMSVFTDIGGLIGDIDIGYRSQFERYINPDLGD